MRENSVDVESSWFLLQEFNRQTFDRYNNIEPEFVNTERECGEIQAYNFELDKASGKKPVVLNKFNGNTCESSIFDDAVMVDLIENNKADIFTTDQIAAAIMCGNRSNYSYDIEVKKYGN